MNKNEKLEYLTTTVIQDIEGSLNECEWIEHTKTRNVIDVAWALYQDLIEKFGLDVHDIFYGLRHYISNTRTKGMKICRCGCGKVGETKQMYLGEVGI